MSLDTWLETIIGEERHQATLAADNDPAPWRYEHGDVIKADGLRVAPDLEDIAFGAHTARRVAAWDPARVIADADAKLHIIGLYRASRESVDLVSNDVWTALKRVLWELAQAYRDRSGFDPEWVKGWDWELGDSQL
jgi:hypothetical protein